MPKTFSASPTREPADRLDDAERQLVTRSVSTLLLVPEHVCRRRPCRRARGCVMVGRDGRPDCLRTAPPDVLALHRALQAETIRLLEMIAFAPSTPVEPPSRDPDDRELQDAAVEILQALLPRQGILRERFRAWRRKRDAAARPPYAGQDLAEYRDFRRYIRAGRISPELRGASPACLPRPPGRRNGDVQKFAGANCPLTRALSYAAAYPARQAAHFWVAHTGFPPARAGPYSAAALSAAASNTAANAAAITSGPAPGLVASAERI
ncbi:hypothetical protein IB238_06010 [Rhizobium sp. ARZ01]|uniref:hypothetical protein n=1 Tax=Rhizobium sp. ARZ01 TaxID=2769313 RepID=UPI00177C6B17|nr:hypothetical protein [Rhizobium sp. ARZ01]MBD9372183.1 hypothetical protein [Rhizobium sp. ARZ01]